MKDFHLFSSSAPPRLRFSSFFHLLRQVESNDFLASGAGEVAVSRGMLKRGLDLKRVVLLGRTLGSIGGFLGWIWRRCAGRRFWMWGRA
jgi:hypothetical protein